MLLLSLHPPAAGGCFAVIIKSSISSSFIIPLFIFEVFRPRLLHSIIFTPWSHRKTNCEVNRGIQFCMSGCDYRTKYLQKLFTLKPVNCHVWSSRFHCPQRLKVVNLQSLAWNVSLCFPVIIKKSKFHTVTTKTKGTCRYNGHQNNKQIQQMYRPCGDLPPSSLWGEETTSNLAARWRQRFL